MPNPRRAPGAACAFPPVTDIPPPTPAVRPVLQWGAAGGGGSVLLTPALRRCRARRATERPPKGPVVVRRRLPLSGGACDTSARASSTAVRTFGLGHRRSADTRASAPRTPCTASRAAFHASLAA